MSDKTTKSRGFWNMLISAADPELQELGGKIRAQIPEDSPLRWRIAKRAMGVLKGWLESRAEGLPPLAGAVLEKLTDLGDFAVNAESSSHEREKAAVKIADDWMTKMFADAGVRLKKAKDPTAELAKIKQEFAARLQLLETIEAAAKKIEEEKAAKKPAAKTAEPLKIGEEVDSLLAGWKARAARRGYTERSKS